MTSRRRRNGAISRRLSLSDDDDDGWMDGWMEIRACLRCENVNMSVAHVADTWLTRGWGMKRGQLGESLLSFAGHNHRIAAT
jgi:hypothetical protein